MEIKEVFEFLGLPTDIDSVDKLKTKFEGKFITRASAHEDDDISGKISANIYGGLMTEAKRSFGFKTEDIKDKSFRDVFKMGVESLTGKIKTLEESSTNDERYNKLKGEYDALNGKHTQSSEDVLKLRRELDEEKATSANTIKQFKIDQLYGSESSKLQFADGTLDLTKTGFHGSLKSKYKFDLDQDGKTLLVMGQDGKRVPNPKRTGEYLSAFEVMDSEMEAIEGLKKKNPLKGGDPFRRPTPPTAGDPPQPGAKVHPRAAQQVQNLSK